MVVSFDEGRRARILIVPALFAEANAMRRFTLQIMRALDAQGIGSLLPDLPGCNESLCDPFEQTLTRWREAVIDARATFAPGFVLAIRGGCLLAPADLPGWFYAPCTGARLLDTLIRAQLASDKEKSGVATLRETFAEAGRTRGARCAGWAIGDQMWRELEEARVEASENQRLIEPDQFNGAKLWLRAEPGEDARQAALLAKAIASQINKDATELQS